MFSTGENKAISAVSGEEKRRAKASHSPEGAKAREEMPLVPPLILASLALGTRQFSPGESARKALRAAARAAAAAGAWGGEGEDTAGTVAGGGGGGEAMNEIFRLSLAGRASRYGHA